MPNVSKNVEEDKNENRPFVNIDTMGLRRGNRKIKGTKKLIESRHTDPNNKSLAFHAPLAMLILILTAFTTPLTEIMQVGVQQGATCFQSRVMEYHDFLETNFDGTANNISPMAQIYMTTKANKETYNLKEMMQEPDKEKFIEAMNKEVTSLFKEKIWIKVPRQEMKNHYAKQRADGLKIKREQIMMIWSFKRKRHPDGTLDKYKARLCCHGGQQQWGGLTIGILTHL